MCYPLLPDAFAEIIPEPMSSARSGRDVGKAHYINKIRDMSDKLLVQE